MKKIVSLVLAFIMAFSFGISTFASEGELIPEETGYEKKIYINLSKPVEEAEVLYATMAGRYYFALDDEPYENITISSAGCVSASLLEFDPEKMEVYGMDIMFGVEYEGEIVSEPMKYIYAMERANQLNKENKTTLYKAVLLTNVNIFEVTIEDNYGAEYIEGMLKIKATLNGTEVTKTYRIIEDVTLFPLEQVKAAANGFSDWESLECGAIGCSDYVSSVKGESEIAYEDAAVVSVAAFRAIQGKNLRIDCWDMLVELKNIKAGQKGVNFKYYGVFSADFDFDRKTDSIMFGFLGDQVILGDYTIRVDTGYTWETLREEFEIEIEEEPVVSYYILKNGQLVQEIRVDYSIAYVEEPVVLQIQGSDSSLGQYEIVLEAPPSYDVFFNLEDGEWIAKKYYRKGENFDFVIPEEVPTRKWHKFLGWATSKDAEEPEYFPGDVYILNEDVDFYPVWEMEAEAKSKISVTSAATVAGGKAKIKVNLSEPADAACIQFAIKYDAWHFDVVSCESVLLPNATVNYAKDGIIYFTWDDINGLTEGGTLLEIEFEVREDAVPLGFTIDVVENRNIYEMIFADSSTKEFRVEVEDGVLEIVEAVFGDVDGNGKINVLDANVIRRYSAKLLELTDDQIVAADVDGNGNVNVLDANLIRRYAVKLIDKFPVEG
ncbi:MAG: hypothetical protein IKL57_07000 [Oscillospiraceae bacterium]|nr:hypothetical protein [Oscillospiraceae bacterium]